MANSGRSSVIAVTPGTTWNTAAALGASDKLFPLEIDNLLVGGDVVYFDAAGKTERDCVDVPRKTYAPNISFSSLRSGAQWAFWAALMGGDVVSGSSPNVTHTFAWDGDAQKFLTLGTYVDSTSIFECPSLMPIGVNLSADSDGFMTFAYTTIGDTVKINADATNTSTEFGAVTAVESCLRFPFSEMVFRINGRDGAALVAGDEKKIVGLSFEISRQREAEPTSGQVGASEGVTQLPTVGTDFPEITLTIESNEFDDADLDEFNDGTPYKADLIGTKTIGSTNYLFHVEWANLRPLPGTIAMSGGARLGHSRVFACLGYTSTPPGMNSSDPVWSKMVDNHATAYI